MVSRCHSWYFFSHVAHRCQLFVGFSEAGSIRKQLWAGCFSRTERLQKLPTQAKQSSQLSIFGARPRCMRLRNQTKRMQSMQHFRSPGTAQWNVEQCRRNCIALSCIIIGMMAYNYIARYSMINQTQWFFWSPPLFQVLTPPSYTRSHCLK